MRLVGLKEAAKSVGLTEWALRRAAREKRYPYTRCGNRYLFDVEILSEAIRTEMQEYKEQNQAMR